MCITEEQKGRVGVDERVSISMIAICPSTGDVVYDEFEGNGLLDIGGLGWPNESHIRHAYAYRTWSWFILFSARKHLLYDGPDKNDAHQTYRTALACKLT